MSRHALERSAQRLIPQRIAELIVEYGDSRDAGDGARKYALSKQSMRLLRRSAERTLVQLLDRYRRRNAYVVLAGDRIVTVAYASRPLFV